LRIPPKGGIKRRALRPRHFFPKVEFLQTTKKGFLNMAKVKNNSPLEEWEQAQIFSWIMSNQIREKKLQLAYGTLNGVRLAPRLRAKMKAQGNRRGVPDIVLPAKSHCGKFPGLYIELKRVKGGQVSQDQKRYMAMLREQGFKVVVCKGSLEAIGEISAYLGGNLPIF
jgi:predicted peroxiredoxin